jgi:hypothetical protein
MKTKGKTEISECKSANRTGIAGNAAIFPQMI